MVLLISKVLLDCGYNMQAARFGCTWWCSILFFCSVLPVQVCCEIQHNNMYHTLSSRTTISIQPSQQR